MGVSWGDCQDFSKLSTAPGHDLCWRPVQEAMRMYPVAGGTVRNPKKDVLLGGKYLIPKGTTIFLPVRLDNLRI